MSIKKDLQRLKSLKTIPFDAMSKADINFLERKGIINWIWPESYWVIPRWFMTKLFSMVCYKRHDVNFWQQTWFHEANWGLLKYSYLSLAEEYRKICKKSWREKIYLIPMFYLTIPLKSWIIALAYSAVESPAWKEAYNKSK